MASINMQLDMPASMFDVLFHTCLLQTMSTLVARYGPVFRGTLDGLSVAVKVLDRSLAMQVSCGLFRLSGGLVGWCSQWWA